MSFPYHGNYVGPGWSAGKFQSSVQDPSVPSIDAFDEAARQHDASYSKHKSNSNRAKADWDFVKQTKGLGGKAELARSLVAVQALGRDTYNKIMGKPQRKRNGGPSRKKASKTARPKGGRKSARANPIAGRPKRILSSQLANTNTNVTTYFKGMTNGMEATVEGVELIGSLTVTTSMIQGQLLLNQCIGPQFLTGTRIQAYSNMYEKYRYDHAEMVLRSKCGNNTDGSVVAFFERDVSEPPPLASPDAVQRNAQSWGAADIPVKNDGIARMKKISDENPYFTDLGASPNDPLFGQAMAYVQLNSSGGTVTASSKTTHDVLLKYKCRFFIPQLQVEQILFSTFVQPTGAGCSTGQVLGTEATLEQGGNLEGATYNGSSAVTFQARFGHYYSLKVCYNASVAATTLITNPSNCTTVVVVQANASGTSNIVERVVYLTSNVLGNVQTVTVAFGAATLTTPSYASFTISDFGTFNPVNPVAGPDGTISTSKWSQKRRCTQIVKSMVQDTRIAALERELDLFRQNIMDSWPTQEQEKRMKHYGQFLASPPEAEKQKFVRIMDKCKFCFEENPDHEGKDCLSNPYIRRTKSPSRVDNHE